MEARSLFGSSLSDQELLTAVGHGPSLSAEDGMSKIVALVKDGWPGIPPGLRDYPPAFLSTDMQWKGQSFSFWYGVEIYWRNTTPNSWNPAGVISSLDLSTLLSGQTRGIRHSAITIGSFGTSAPAPNQKHKVVSTLASTSLQPGDYQLTLNAGSATFAWLNDVLIYFVTAAGLSVDGEPKWNQTFIMKQNGQNTQNVALTIRLV